MKCECCGQEIREPTSAKFDEFWALYPTKVGKKKCYQSWRSRKLDRMADDIIQNVRHRVENDPRWKAGYVPNPQTYINGDLWEDEIVLQPKVMQWPTKNDEWLELGKKFNINPGIGEGWPQLKDRIRAAAGG